MQLAASDAGSLRHSLTTFDQGVGVTGGPGVAVGSSQVKDRMLLDPPARW